MNGLEQLPVLEIQAREYANSEPKTVLVDGDYDGEYLSGYRWRILPSGYVYRANNVKQPGGRYKTTGIYLHHLVLPKKKGYWVTHINGNKLDNRSANLAYITPRKSAGTRPDYRESSRRKQGEYRGVHPLKGPNGWVSAKTFIAICAQKYLGTFPTKKEAALAYDKAARLRWGPEAKLNFPVGEDENRCRSCGLGVKQPAIYHTECLTSREN